ncbi:MAG: S8 family peptidase [Candidatus Berkelbacteria bacterium]|nr:S8 family peptidase [Candidatus Berkelbacteria bacterium]
MNKFHKIMLADGRAKVTIPTLLLVLTGLILASYLAVASGDINKAEANAPFADNRIIVKFKEEASPQLKNEAQIKGPDVGIASVSDINRKEGAKEVTELTAKKAQANQEEKNDNLDRIYKIEFEGKKDIKKLVQEYSKDANIEYAEPDYQVKLTLEPNDPYYGSSGSWGQGYPDLWGIKKIQSASAWDLSTGSRNVVVAVIDTGVDYTNPELVQNIWVNSDEIAGNGFDDDHNGYIDDYYGYDFYNYDGDPMDDHAHGTHCSGTIGALGNNNIGVVGVNWQVKIMAAKFLSSGGSGYTSDAVSAIHYAVDNGANVLSNSWGGGGFDQSLQDAINYAYAHNVSFIAAAGNSNANATNFYPCSYNNVVCIAATDYQDQKASFSNYGNTVDLSAPGVDILSLKSSHATYSCTTVGGNYCRMSGTSMATPHVAGLAALVLAYRPGSSPDTVFDYMRNGADDLGSSGKDIYFGYGRINSYRTLTGAPPPPSPSPSSSTSPSSSPSACGHVDGTIVKTDNKTAIYLIESCKKRHIPSPEVFSSWFNWGDVVIISSGEMNSYTTGSDLTFQSGSLIRASDQPEVYVIVGAIRRHIASPSVFEGLGYKWSNIVITNSAEILKYSSAENLTKIGSHPDGSVIKSISASEVYLIDGGKKRHLSNPEVFTSRYRWEEILMVTPSEVAGYPIGDRVGFRSGSLVRASNQSTVYVITDTTKRHILSPETFQSKGYRWDRIILTSTQELNNYTNGPDI